VHYAKDSSAPTWLVGLDYKLTENVLLYGKYSRGYRQGSVQPFSVPGHTTYDPEKVDAYELGFKTSFDGPIRGTFNLAAFYNKLTDQQLLYGFASSTNSAPGNAAIVNAGASRVYGAEVDTMLIPFHGFRVSLSYAYLNTMVQELGVIPPDPATGYDISLPLSVAGDPLPYSTKHKLSADVNYTLPLNASIGAVSVGATYTYQSALYISRSSPYGLIPSYSLVNTNLNWNGIFGSGFDVSLFVTNTFDKQYRSAITNSWGSFGYEIEVPGEPRMYGARLRYRFGT
jgi:iron complex outermembrane receptor protein